MKRPGKERKKNEKTRKQKKNLVAEKLASFPATVEFHGTHAKRRPQHGHPLAHDSQHHQDTYKGRKDRKLRERERDFGKEKKSR